MDTKPKELNASSLADLDRFDQVGFIAVVAFREDTDAGEVDFARLEVIGEHYALEVSEATPAPVMARLDAFILDNGLMPIGSAA